MSRIKFHDDISNFQIIISPGNKDLIPKILLGIIFLCFGLIPDFFMFIQIFSDDKGEAKIALVGFICWSSFFLFLFRNLLWEYTGAEILTIGQGKLIIKRKRLLFSKPQTYPLNEVVNFIVGDAVDRKGRISKCIQFDYQNKIVEFGAGINQEEADEVMKKLRDRKIIPAVTHLVTDHLSDEIDTGENLIFKTKIKLDVPLGKIRLSQTESISKVIVAVIGSIAIIWFLINCIHLEFGIINSLIMFACMKLFFDLGKIKLIDFDRDNLYINDSNAEVTISLDHILGMKILPMSSNGNRLWKIFYKNVDGTEKAFIISPIQENLAKFKALLTELNPRVEIDYSIDFLDMFFPVSLKANKLSDQEKIKKKRLTIAFRILINLIFLYMIYLYFFRRLF